MRRTFFYLSLLILIHSCVENKLKAYSVTKSVFSVDAARPVIQSGFYPLVEDHAYTIRRKFFSFEKDDPEDGKEFFLNPAQAISFDNIDSITLSEEYRYNSFMLTISLNLPGAHQLNALTSKANDLTLKTFGQRIGIVADNTLVLVLQNYEVNSNGIIQLSRVYNKDDVERMKKYFDKAVAFSKSNNKK